MIKSIRKTTHNVVCDHCQNVCVTDEIVLSEARQQAKAWGWSRVKGRDLCDLCTETLADAARSGSNATGTWT